MARSKKVVAKSGDSGKKVAELVWATVLGVAATSNAYAAPHKSPEGDDFANKAAEEKAGMALGLVGGAGAEAAGEAMPQLPADVAQLIQAALDGISPNDMAAGSASNQAYAELGMVQADGLASMDGAHALDPVYVAAATNGETVSDAGGGLWSGPVHMADASAATGGAASGGSGAVASAEAAAPAAMAYDMSLVGLLGVGAIAAAASGGGGGSSATTPTPTPTPAAVPMVKGSVVDGYVAGATVFVDADGDGQLDAGEVSGVTDAHGQFSLSGSFAQGAKVVVQAGGLNVGLGGANTGTITQLNAGLEGAVDADGNIVVSPLTTLLANSPGLTEAALKASLGIADSVDIGSYDPLAALQAGGADAAVAETVFAKAQQVMTIMQTAVASGVSLDTAAATIGQALAQPDGNLNTAVEHVVTSIAATSTAFADTTAQAQLAASINNINASIETAYGNLAEALSTNDAALLADSLAVTAVAQTDFLDAVLQSANQGEAVGIAQFQNDSTLTAKVIAAADDIANHVQTLDVQSLNSLSDMNFDFGDTKFNVVVKDAADMTLLNETLSQLGHNGAVDLAGLQIDSTLSDMHDQILADISGAGIDAGVVNVVTGDY